ncbi:hypothetical protein BGZ65_008513, partial [Modicella reniformis]
MAQVMHLEQYRLSQEAARCFEDDLDFCPSLTSKELSEIILTSILAQKESHAKQLQFQQHHQHQRLSGVSSPTSPTTPTATTPGASRAIAIVDPTSGTPLYIPPTTISSKINHVGLNRSGRYSGSTTPATAGLM